MMGESNTPIPDELTMPLSNPTRRDLQKSFPFGDPQKFAITIDHVKNGDFDEKPVHKVKISQPFFMGVYEVTNAQYEQFDPLHHQFRGKNGFSKEDSEAVVFVSWGEANAFCKWLSQKEGLTYRLPTEAEWEYACRAGTTTLFSTGDSLPDAFKKNARRTSFTEPQDIVNLAVGKTPANPWGLFDLHGNGEEWCYDWYGPYEAAEQIAPIGHANGDFKVTRGGSHGTDPYYLRSANRSGTLPENKNWLIGFRAVIGQLSSTLPLPEPETYRLNVKQDIPAALKQNQGQNNPYFRGPRQYVKIPKGAHGPLYAHHNHDPAITDCPNGDLLAIWYTCVEEKGRELAIAASRLRYGEEEWQPASLFWDAPDRNDHCPALWFDGEETIYHFNGLCVAGMWEPLAIIMRTSKDNGVTWSKARIIVPEHGYRQMVGEPVFRTQDGSLVFGADAQGGSTIWVSKDNGQTWADPGGTINGIHAGIAQLDDGRLMALGRNQNIDGWMPMSISSDLGKTWETTASIFPPLGGGQRAALIRLKEGPLFFASFADNIKNFTPILGDKNSKRQVSNLFGALSFDGGKTWPIRRIISDCEPDHAINTIDGAPIRMNKDLSEPQGYLSVCQSSDGLIQLISSINHYTFNMAWLMKGQPEGETTPVIATLPVRRTLSTVYDNEKLPNQTNSVWNFLTAKTNEKSVVEVMPNRSIKIKVGSVAEWSNERIADFTDLDSHRGFTVETRVQVSGAHHDSSGFVFNVYARSGTLTTNHYKLLITSSSLFYWYNNAFIKIAENLDNASGLHTFRLSIRNDAVVQIYRDKKLIAVQPQDLIISWAQPARGSYIQFGIEANNVEVLLNHISYDLTGAYRP